MRTWIILLLLLRACQGNAQGILGFFTQQDTKKKDMAQQIALLETNLQEVKSGYKTTENGLTTIHDLKNGSFSLHTGYFNSLNIVSPSVANNPKIKEIEDYQRQIDKAIGNELSWQQGQSILNAGEMSYLQKVCTYLLSDCNEALAELEAVVTPGKLQMKDEDRINRIDGIYSDMQDKAGFCQSFTANVRAFALNRKNNKEQLQQIQELYNLK